MNELDRNVTAWPPSDAFFPGDLSSIEAVPLTAFLFKIASRCNLDCDYCYVYRGPDQSWRRKPKIMSRTVVEQAIRRISDHVVSHGLEDIFLVLHGGEPLLAGLDLIDFIFTSAKSSIPCNVHFSMQTNVTLLTPQAVDLFYSHRVRIGVSLDGPEVANDRHRVDHQGKSSFGQVEKGLKLLTDSEKGKQIFSGILAVIDLSNDPCDTFDYLSGLGTRSIDFLLPDGTHDDVPSGKNSFEDTAYADWLIQLFDYWWAKEEDQTPIRIFDNIISLLFNGKSDTEYLGIEPVELVVIESDGSLEAVDTLKAAFDGAPDLGINIFNYSFEDALQRPAIRSRMAGAASLSEECRTCPLLRICGGGYLPHRYSKINGFLNPSVYCRDLSKLILHIRKRVSEEVGVVSDRTLVTDEKERGVIPSERRTLGLCNDWLRLDCSDTELIGAIFRHHSSAVELSRQTRREIDSVLKHLSLPDWLSPIAEETVCVHFLRWCLPLAEVSNWDIAGHRTARAMSAHLQAGLIWRFQDYILDNHCADHSKKLDCRKATSDLLASLQRDVSELGLAWSPSMTRLLFMFVRYNSRCEKHGVLLYSDIHKRGSAFLVMPYLILRGTRNKFLIYKQLIDYVGLLDDLVDFWEDLAGNRCTWCTQEYESSACHMPKAIDEFKRVSAAMESNLERAIASQLPIWSLLFEDARSSVARSLDGLMECTEIKSVKRSDEHTAI